MSAIMTNAGESELKRRLVIAGRRLASCPTVTVTEASWDAVAHATPIADLRLLVEQLKAYRPLPDDWMAQVHSRVTRNCVTLEGPLMRANYVTRNDTPPTAEANEQVAKSVGWHPDDFRRLLMVRQVGVLDDGTEFIQPTRITAGAIEVPSDEFGVAVLKYTGFYRNGPPGMLMPFPPGCKWRRIEVLFDGVLIGSLSVIPDVVPMQGDNLMTRATITLTAVDVGAVRNVLRTSQAAAESRITGWAGFSDGLCYHVPVVIEFANPIEFFTGTGWQSLRVRFTLPPDVSPSLKAADSRLMAVGLYIDSKNAVAYPVELEPQSVRAGDNIEVTINA